MALEVNIKKKLGDFNLDVSFTAKDEILALFGESGCGKSMTLKCIAGIEKPDSGRIVLNDRILFDSEKKINLSPQKRKVGYLFQQYALFPHMTVKKNIMTGINEKNKNKEIIVNENIKKFYLEGMEDKYPSELSGGQQQRVALARIFASEPEVLLLDEPFSAMDSYLKWQLEMELVNILKTFNNSSIFVTHNKDEVYRICNRVSVMKQGINEEEKNVKKLFMNPESLSAALLTGCKNFSNIEKISNKKVFATDWGIELETIENDFLGKDFMGVRAHDIKLAKENDINVIKCDIQSIVEELFSIVIILKPEKSSNENSYSRIRMEISKDKWEQTKDIKDGKLNIKICPKDIMILS